MIKVNDHKTVEKVIFLMHYHKDWKVRKKNWKRYKCKTYFWLSRSRCLGSSPAGITTYMQVNQISL